MATSLLPPPIGGSPEAWQQWTVAFNRYVNDFLGARTSNFTPVATGLTTVGSITNTGYYLRVGNLIRFYVLITSSGGGTSASVLGTTTVDLPFAAALPDMGYVVNVTTGTKVGDGFINSAVNKMYLPTWVATTNQMLVIGTYIAA